MSSSKVVIVTGSGGGVGKATAKKFLDKGFKVCVSDINEELGKATFEEFKETFGDDMVMFVRCDIAKQEDWQQMWNEVKKTFGYVDILINNAAIGKKFGWNKCLEVDAIGTSYGIKLAVENMGKSKGGKGGTIINIGSMNGLFLGRRMEFEDYGYGVAKNTVHMMTKAVSMVTDKEGVHSFALCLSIVDTNFADFKSNPRVMGYIKRIGMSFMTPEYVASRIYEAFKMNKSGALWACLPDRPLLDLAQVDTTKFFFLLHFLIVGKILGKLGLQNVPITLTHMILLLVIILWIVLLCIQFALSFLW